MNTLESLKRKIGGAEDLKSVVRSMKAMAASNIGQYEMAVSSLGNYHHSIALGMKVYLNSNKKVLNHDEAAARPTDQKRICAIVFGSDQGLVGQFNESLTGYVAAQLWEMPGEKEIWAIGERVQVRLADEAFNTSKLFSVPNTVDAVTPLVAKILVKAQEALEKGTFDEFHIFHNRPNIGSGYTAIAQRLLPLDKQWMREFEQLEWPTYRLPQVVGKMRATLQTLIREYLFVSLFRACAESLASENASRLEAMHRADKNIKELLEELGLEFHSLRQSSIDEELFDVIAGFEMLSDTGVEKKNKKHERS